MAVSSRSPPPPGGFGSGLGREGSRGWGRGWAAQERSALYLCGVGMLLRTPGVTRQFPNSVFSGSFPHPCFALGLFSFPSVKGRSELRVQLNPKGSYKEFKAVVWEVLSSRWDQDAPGEGRTCRAAQGLFYRAQ